MLTKDKRLILKSLIKEHENELIEILTKINRCDNYIESYKYNKSMKKVCDILERLYMLGLRY
jgi:hypothetical protein